LFGLFLPPHNLLPKRRQGEFGHFKMLGAKGDANNSYVEKNPKKQMSQANTQSSKDDPQNIHQDRQASAAPFVNNFASKGPQCQKGELDGLDSKRNPDDGNHQTQACDQIPNSGKEAAKDQPDNIAQKFH